GPGDHEDAEDTHEAEPDAPAARIRLEPTRHRGRPPERGLAPGKPRTSSFPFRFGGRDTLRISGKNPASSAPSWRAGGPRAGTARGSALAARRGFEDTRTGPVPSRMDARPTPSLAQEPASPMSKVT